MCSIQDLAGCSDSMTVAVTTTQNNCSVFTQSAKSDNLINLENNLQCQAEETSKQIVQKSMPVNLRLNMKLCLRLNNMALLVFHLNFLLLYKQHG